MKVISIVSSSQSGRAALVGRLVRELEKHGTVSTVRQSQEEALPHGYDVVKGTAASVVVTPTQSVKMFRGTDVESALRELAADGPDFVVVDGFEDSALPKIAIGGSKAANLVATVGDGATGKELADVAMAQPDRVTLFDLIAKIRRNPEIKNAGAIGTFTGIVRELSKEETTKALEFESYDAVARERIAQIERELKAKPGIVDVLIHHKTGRITAGEDIVFIVVAAGHRQELFPVLREGIERVKEEVPIWKKEITVSGEYWVHDEEMKKEN